MRTKRNEIRDYINVVIQNNSTNWQYQKGANFGIRLQVEVGNFFLSNAEKLQILNIQINTNPNDTRPDIVITYNNGAIEGFEVKSCKDGALGGVTICNAPHLINDSQAFLINYTVNDNNTIYVIDVYQTELFRLTSINSHGKYKGCLISTRDTGKKITGRNFNDFILSSETDDYSLEQLTDPNLIRKTVLYYSASKLVDDEYMFTDEDILNAIHHLRLNS